MPWRISSYCFARRPHATFAHFWRGLFVYLSAVALGPLAQRASVHPVGNGGICTARHSVPWGCRLFHLFSTGESPCPASLLMGLFPSFSGAQRRTNSCVNQATLTE